MNRIAWVANKLIDGMASEADTWSPKESGGILLGYWVSEDEVVVTDMIGPGPNAVHRRSSFTPDEKWQEKEVARIYQRSGRVATYLGDWHSHPYGTKELSFKDIMVMFRIACHKPARAKTPIMGILWNRLEWKFALWSLSPRCLAESLKPLEVVRWESTIDLMSKRED